MKIAIPVNENKKEVCPSFGRTPLYLLLDTETQEKVYYDNSAVANEGGAGIKAAQILADKEIDVLLTPRCGQNAADVLKLADIKIYRTRNSSLAETLELFQKGELSILEEIHPGFHNHGGK